RTDEIGQHPLSVRGKRQGGSLTQPYRRRAVHLAQVHGVSRTSRFPLLREDDRLSIRGQVRGIGPLQTREIPLLRLSGKEAEKSESRVALDEEHAPVARDVLQRHAGGGGRDRALPSRQRDSIEGAGGAGLS